MIKIINSILSLILLIIILFISPLFNKKPIVVTEKIPSNLIVITSTIDLNELNYEKINLHGIRVTAYNNDRNQTDSTPNTMASNRIVYKGAVAISSDIRKKYNLRFGDIVYLPYMDTYFIFEDGMANGNKKNERVIKNTIDIFMYDRKTAKNFRLLNQEVVIYKFPRNQ